MIMLNDGAPAFFIGQVVQHRRYGYRGVIVACDLSCQAPDEWYYSNRSQPPRDKPWYHVLVHGPGGSTYAAESSLQAEENPQPVSHPGIIEFFNSFTDGHYVRNDVPWTGW